MVHIPVAIHAVFSHHSKLWQLLSLHLSDAMYKMIHAVLIGCR